MQVQHKIHVLLIRKCHTIQIRRIISAVGKHYAYYFYDQSYECFREYELALSNLVETTNYFERAHPKFYPHLKEFSGKPAIEKIITSFPLFHMGDRVDVCRHAYDGELRCVS